MLRAQDVLAAGVLSTKGLLARYLAGFDESTRLAQPPNLPNHVAWSLGHLALTLHRVAERLDGLPMPERDITNMPEARGMPATSFHRDDVAFGSAPAMDHERYPSLRRCQEIYDHACDRLAAAVQAASDEALEAPTVWGAPGTPPMPLHLLVARMIFHNGAHTGQIADTRRALGFRSVFA